MFGYVKMRGQKERRKSLLEREYCERSPEARKSTHTHGSKELVPAGHTAFPHIMVQKAILREEKHGEVAWTSELRISA